MEQEHPGNSKAPWTPAHHRRLLAGKKIDMPPIRQVDKTFKKAEKHVVDTAKQKPIQFKDDAPENDRS